MAAQAAECIEHTAGKCPQIGNKTIAACGQFVNLPAGRHVLIFESPGFVWRQRAMHQFAQALIDLTDQPFVAMKKMYKAGETLIEAGSLAGAWVIRLAGAAIDIFPQCLRMLPAYRPKLIRTVLF